MTEYCTDATPSLCRLVYFTSHALQTCAEKILKPHDLTPEQFHLLKSMSPDAGLTQRQIGGLVNKTPANMTRILDRLQGKGLVVRRSSLADRRISLVFLTPKGAELVEEIGGWFEAFAARLTEGISAEDRETAMRALETIGRNIEQSATACETDKP
jgi:DNA-binding MarR family transcriptional regulator